MAAENVVGVVHGGGGGTRFNEAAANGRGKLDAQEPGTGETAALQ